MPQIPRDKSLDSTLALLSDGYNFISKCCKWITIAIMKEALKLLSAMRYDVPEQDLQINLSTMPAIPKSQFLINNVRQID